MKPYDNNPISRDVLIPTKKNRARIRNHLSVNIDS